MAYTNEDDYSDFVADAAAAAAAGTFPRLTPGPELFSSRFSAKVHIPI